MPYLRNLNKRPSCGIQSKHLLISKKQRADTKFSSILSKRSSVTMERSLGGVIRDKRRLRRSDKTVQVEIIHKLITHCFFKHFSY